MTTNAPLLAIRDIWHDNVETWSLKSGRDATRDRVKAALGLFAPPLVAALACAGSALVFDRPIRVYNVGQILSGVAVFTGLLFALLVLMFNTGLALRKDGNVLRNAHQVERVIADLRSNVTYSACVALLLAVVLVAAAATHTNAGKGLAWGGTPLMIFLGLHLVINLTVILRRLRTAFNYLTR